MKAGAWELQRLPAQRSERRLGDVGLPPRSPALAASRDLLASGPRVDVGLGKLCFSVRGGQRP